MQTAEGIIDFEEMEVEDAWAIVIKKLKEEGEIGQDDTTESEKSEIPAVYLDTV